MVSRLTPMEGAFHESGDRWLPPCAARSQVRPAARGLMGSQTAEPALTWSHSASCERLHLVGARHADRRNFTQLTASAHEGLYREASEGRVPVLSLR